MEDTTTITPTTTNEHQLWVNLSALTEGNLSGMLPRLIKEMLGSDPFIRDDLDNFEITLPSDFEWRTKVYYRLLEKQRLSQSMEEQIPEENLILHEWNIIPPKTEKPFCLPNVRHLHRKNSDNSERKLWRVSDIAKAAALLLTPPQKIEFRDEQEMRRVYTLIYDVFRYKSVLCQALKDISFFLLYPQYIHEQSRLWLLLYDMYHRGFKKREVRMQPVAAKMFADCRLTGVEEALWQQRVKLAAAIARLRIEKSALNLSDLLPAHLRDGKIYNQDKAPVTCWVNIRKIKNRAALCDEISSKLGLTLLESELNPGPNNFKWDPHCPHFLILHPSTRTKLAQSALVKKHKLIVQIFAARFLDDYTHFTAVYLREGKYEATEATKDFINESEAKWNSRTGKIRCDNGKAYVNNELKKWCKNKGIVLDYTIPYTPQLNGKAERLNRTVMEKRTYLIFDSGLDKNMWGEATRVAAYIINRSPTVTLPKTPFEVWMNEKPNVKYMQVFGAEVYAKQLGYLKKLDERSKEYVFVGYGPQGYRLFDTTNKKIIISRDLLFWDKQQKSSFSDILNEESEEDIEAADQKKEKVKETVEQSEGPEQDATEMKNEENEMGIGNRTKKIPAKLYDYHVYLTFEEATTGENKDRWLEATEDEKQSLDENDT
ncbi:hypothetical protein Trydic_g12582 [Trypoxylus dichotomus]